MAKEQIKVKKTTGVQPEAASRMIGEGGIGSETYYFSKEESNLPIDETINKLIANQGVLYIKLHQYHWHVQGNHFFVLHEKFEQLYNETTEYMDAFAERLIAKGVRPLSTLKQFIQYATIEENQYIKKIPAEEMVKDIRASFSNIKTLVKEGIQEARQVDDDVTEDMLIAYEEYIDTTVWMLSAYIK